METGRLPLKAPLDEFFPEFAHMRVGTATASGDITYEPAQPIYIQDLYRHTSGLVYGARGHTPMHKFYPPSSAGSAINLTGAEFVAKLAAAPLLYQPGTVWDYSLSVDLLGQVIEKVTGAGPDKPLPELLAVPLLVWTYVWLLRRKKKLALRYASLSIVKEALGQNNSIRRHIPPALFLLAIIAMLLAAALKAGCTTFYTEDLQHGQKIGGLTIRNPFRS